MPLPIEIVGKNRRAVRIVWDEDHKASFSAQELRQRCRCANCIHEFTGERLLDPTTVPDTITVTDMELQGSYGIRIMFSDGHGTGIFRFADLMRDCPCDACDTRRKPAGAS
jgi:DUF971 family protein